MRKILVSACLLGAPVRYDGASKPLASTLLDAWQAEGRLIPFCPEQAGGLATPRPVAELQGGDGWAVLQGLARVRTANADDVTDAFLKGAQAALQLAQQHGVQLALLKARSPSCGNEGVYDGSFSQQLQAGQGVTSALLRQHGIAVFNETQLAALQQRLAALD